eukprot:38466_1
MSNLPPIYVSWGKIISMENNNVSYLSSFGNILIWDVATVLLYNNIFTFSDESFSYPHYVSGMIDIEKYYSYSDPNDINISVVANYFGTLNNHSMAALYVNKVYGCLYGNIFDTHRALNLDSSVLGSCFRPNLINKISGNDYTECDDIYPYASFKKSLYGFNQIFDVNEEAIIQLHYSSLILDNTYFKTNALNRSNNKIKLGFDGLINFMIIDSVVNDVDTDFEYDSFQYGYRCDQLLIKSKLANETGIAQMVVTNGDQSKHIEYINNFSPIFIQLIYNMSYFPGALLQIQYIITDKYNNPIQYSEKFFSKEIQLVLQNEALGVIFLTIDKQTGICDSCNSGIYFAEISIKDTGKTYNITVSEMNNLLLTTGTMAINVTDCIIGYGVNEFETQCQLCPKGYFKLTNSNTKCVECNANAVGITCSGGFELIVQYNYWMTIIQDENNENKPYLVSAMCPSGYCCSIKHGCNYLLNQSKLCASNRNYTTKLCGECNNEYSELLLSTACGQCHGNNYWLLFIPFIWAAFTTYYLLLVDSQINVRDGLISNNMT